MTNPEIWLILYAAILTDDNLTAVSAATQADLALEQYLDRFANDKV